MKKLNIKYFSILALVFMVGCEAPTVGYNTYERAKDYKFSLGSEESIEIAMSFDKAWNERDFETMTSLASDSIKFSFFDGVDRDFDYVKDLVKRQDSVREANGSSIEADLKHVYSVVLNPNNGFNYVQSAVVYTATDSVGKINKWRVFERFAVKDGKVQRFGGAWQDIPEETE